MERQRPDYEDAKELMAELLMPFNHTYRDMRIPTGVPGEWRNENDAEHSWSLGVLACSLAPHIDPTLDVGLVAQLSLVHDLPEVYAQDTPAWKPQAEIDTKDEREAEARRKIEEKFGHFPWLTGMIDLYERQDTPEACYVNACDKFIAMCQRFTDGGEFWRENGVTKEIYDERLEGHRQKAHRHAGMAVFYELIRAEYNDHPEHFAPSHAVESGQSET